MAHLEKFLSDYRPLTYTINSCELIFKINDDSTIVENRLHISKTSNHNDNLILDGINLELINISIDGEIIDESNYTRDNEKISIGNLSQSFEIYIVTRIYPEKNTELE